MNLNEIKIKFDINDLSKDLKKNFLNFIRNSFYKSLGNYKVSKISLNNTSKFSDNDIIRILEYIPVYHSGEITFDFKEKNDYFASDLISEGAVKILCEDYYLFSLDTNENITGKLVVEKKYYSENIKYFPFSRVFFDETQNVVVGKLKKNVFSEEKKEIFNDFNTYIEKNIEKLKITINNF